MKASGAAGLAVAALLLVVTGFVLGRRGERSSAGTSDGPNQAVAANRVRTDNSANRAAGPGLDERSLQLKVQLLEQRLSQLESARNGGASAPRGEASSEPAKTPRLSPRDYEAARQAALDASEQQFRAATGTSDWGRRFEATCASFRPRAGWMQSVSCHADLCRVEVAHDTAEDSARFVDEIEMDPRFGNLTIRWFYANREKTRRILFIQPAQRPVASSR